MTLDELLDQRLRALQTCSRFDHDFDLAREAGQPCSTFQCEAYAMARHTVRLLERDIAREQEKMRKAAEEEARYECAPESVSAHRKRVRLSKKREKQRAVDLLPDASAIVQSGSSGVSSAPLTSSEEIEITRT